MEPWASPTGRMCWDASTRRARLWRRQSRRREGLWKRRGLEKSKSRLSHPAWKSRKLRGIPTFPQPRRRQVKLLNRTFHALQKADILTCYGQMAKHPHCAGAADKAVNLVGCKSPHHQLPGQVVSISDACGGNEACSART